MKPIFHWMDEVDSTNSAADKLRRQGCPEWTVVVARSQTSGRGRMGREWTSPVGGLYMTLVLRPGFEPERFGWLALAAGVATAEALTELLQAPAGLVQLKWPNDVLLRGRKVGGLLGEARLDDDGPAVLLGIGLNLSFDPALLPERPLYPASTVEAETGVALEPEPVAAALLARFEPWYELLSAEGPARLERRFAELSAHAGRTITLRDGELRWTGRDVGLSAQGGLALEVEGRRREFVAGHIESILDGDSPLR